MNRPINTLFMLSSLDGKISTGDTDIMDVDSDFPLIDGVKEGLHQYYDIEKTTDYFSLNSGKVWEKIGFNNKKEKPNKITVNFVLIDNKPHLNKTGIKYVSELGERLILVTTNDKHPAFEIKDDLGNIEILKYDSEIDFKDMFERLKNDFGAQRVTIQSGGTLNSKFIRDGLVDYVSLVIAPVIVGGKDTATFVDGESLHRKDELDKIKSLKLESVNKLKNSYLHLIYKVIN